VCYKCAVTPPEGGAAQPVAEDNAVGSAAADGTAVGPLFRITVDAPEMGCSETGEPVVFYCVSATRLSDGLATRVHRRFRDFFALNDAVRAAYQGSHLLGSLPEPPPRGFKFFENHSDPAFVERRRWLLADYLLKLEAVPRVRANADFVAFLGLVGTVRETSCFFPANAPLGLSLGKREALTEVAALKPLPDGRPSVAMLSSVIVVGDTVRGSCACRAGAAGRPAPLLRPNRRAPPRTPQISKVNGEDVLSMAHEVLLARLKSAPRPLLLHFLGEAWAVFGLGGGGGGRGDAPAPPPAAPKQAAAALPQLPPPPAPTGPAPPPLFGVEQGSEGLF
jgi:hypothetical protein